MAVDPVEHLMPCMCAEGTRCLPIHLAVTCLLLRWGPAPSCLLPNYKERRVSAAINEPFQLENHSNEAPEAAPKVLYVAWLCLTRGDPRTLPPPPPP